MLDTDWATRMLKSIDQLDTDRWPYEHQEAIDHIWDELANWRSQRTITQHLNLIIARANRDALDLPDHDDGVPAIP